MGNDFASGFQDYVACIRVDSVVSGIVHTCVCVCVCVVERNGDVKIAMCDGEGSMRGC